MHESLAVNVICSFPWRISKVFAPIPSNLTNWLVQLYTSKECPLPEVGVYVAPVNRNDIYISVTGIHTIPSLVVASKGFKYTGEMIHLLTGLPTQVHDGDKILRSICFARRFPA
ncbi:MAG: hypothetical protein JWL75_794 [Parcubacteria group bacterium]|nr:hypothetical protein [Parcubacteria group bacterium]